MAPEDTIVKGLQAVALHFDKSVRQVQRWVKEPGFPRLSGRRFDLLQVQAWLDEKDGRAPAAPARGGDPRQPDLPIQWGREFEDSRMKKARADLLELDLRQRRSELVPRRDVEQLFVARILAVKQGLLSLARALPPQLAIWSHEREMAPIIDKAVRDLLEAFARPLPDSLGYGIEGHPVAQVADGL